MKLKYTDVNRPVRVEFTDGKTVTGLLYGLQFTMSYEEDRMLCSTHETQVPGPLEYSFNVTGIDLTVMEGHGTVVTFLDTEERIEL